MNLQVCHVVCSASFAGVERHVTQLALAQSALGHEVSVVGGDVHPMREALRASAVRHWPGATVPSVTQRLRHVLTTQRPDVVHAHMTAAEVAAEVARVTSRRQQGPLVVTRHFAAPRGSQSLVRGLLALAAAQRVSAQIAVSGYVAQRIEGTSTVVYPGVPLGPDTRPGQRDRTVLVAQRLEEEKRTDLALSAFAHSGLAGRGWRLLVAGSGSQRGRLEGQAHDLGLDEAISFLGSRSDVAELMQRAGLLLAPCPAEGLGLSVLEAMACGLPVVAAASGGHLETVGLVDNCFLYPPLDTALAGRLMASLAEDPETSKSYGDALQRAQRQRFTLSGQAQATEQVYRSVL